MRLAIWFLLQRFIEYSVVHNIHIMLPKDGILKCQTTFLSCFIYQVVLFVTGKEIIFLYY